MLNFYVMGEMVIGLSQTAGSFHAFLHVYNKASIFINGRRVPCEIPIIQKENEFHIWLAAFPVVLKMNTIPQNRKCDERV